MSDSPQGRDLDVLLDLDALLRQAASVDDADVARADLTAGYRDLHEEIVHRGRDLAPRSHVARRRRRARRGLLLGAAVAAVTAFAVAPTGAAAAGWVSTHTGWFGAPGTTESGTGEELDLGARDFPDVARQLALGISYPPGDSADTYIALLQSTAREDEAATHGRSLMEDAGVRTTLRLDATCAWSGYWLDARRSGNVDKQASAVRGLVGGPAVLVDVSAPRGPLVPAWAAARAGDVATVQQFWTVNCDSLPQPWKGK